MPLFMLLLMLLLLDWCQLIDAFAAATVTSTSPYLQTVIQWLDQENVDWQMDPDNTFPQTHQPVLRLTVEASPTAHANAPTFLYLHLLKSPTRSSDCISPTCARDMTNYAQCMSLKLIHLHEDVWHSKPDIVKSRLQMRLNKLRGTTSRVFARKTVARRIDAATAIPFLQEHHLWSATKARYYYGLFLPSQKSHDNGEVLVAVATFSSNRKIVGLHQRNTNTRSHELLRFCARRDSVVVGGITKLIRAFVKDQQSSDDNDANMCIVTVIDRDWGPGDGWNSIGFETLHVMAPVVMVVGDGIPVRRHLVGAGILNPTNHTSTKPNGSGRPGLETHVLDDLADTHTYQDSIECLEKHNYYTVYDAGVERLLLVVPQQQPQRGKKASESTALWTTCVPSYAATYYSTNKGISALLNHVMALAITGSSIYGRPSSEPNPDLTLNKANDSLQARQHTAYWKATRGTARNATLLYTVPSSMDSQALVQVRERPGGWCTLGIVGGATKSIYHGNFKLVHEHGTATDTGIRRIDSSVMVSEYLRTMASVALVALEFRKAHPDTVTNSDPYTDIGVADDDPNANKKALSFLYLGYGAGSLPRFMASTITGSRHVAIELDEGVVSAAQHCRLLGQSSDSDSSTYQVELQLGDALVYQRPAPTTSTVAMPGTRTTSDKGEKQQESFDVVFVDIFDGDNLLPKDFYSNVFLEHIQQNLLGGRSDGMVIHNFHSGGKARRAQLEDAMKAYRGAFSTTLVVESLDSRHSGGNTVLLAMNQRRLDASSETLSWHAAGEKAQKLWGVNFDVATRSTHKLWLS